MLVTEQLLTTANALVNGLTKLQALEQAASTLLDDRAVVEQKVAANANEQGIAIETVAESLRQLVDAFTPSNPGEQAPQPAPAQAG